MHSFRQLCLRLIPLYKSQPLWKLAHNIYLHSDIYAYICTLIIMLAPSLIRPVNEMHGKEKVFHQRS